MKVNGKDYRTVWRADKIECNELHVCQKLPIYMIEQNLLPFEFKIQKLDTYQETCDAIKNMMVRGAGAIGATAGFAMAQAFIQAHGDLFWNYIERGKEEIEKTRPTAQNLFYATNRVFNAAINNREIRTTAVREAQKIADEDAENCRLIGEHGKALIKNGDTIETHCNAGWLAFVDWGSALSPIYAAHRDGKKIEVYTDKTGPRDQGAKLTAWELMNEGVPHKIIEDNAGASYMKKGDIDMILVGSDRIASNGDVANKIGTLEKAICAYYYGIPFYVAAPTTTIDMDCECGKKIPIEQRSQDEVLYKTGPTKDGKIETIRVASPGSEALNPAFDVVDADLVTGIITEKGIIKPTREAIAKLFS